LRDALRAHDFEQAATFKKAWGREGDVPPGLSEEGRARLAAGRWLVPGTCFRHRKFDYRGVVMGCDPWCTYPTAWRATWVPNRPTGEAQPFYYCIVDERDRARGQTRYVAEENMEHDEVAFPAQAAIVDRFFDCCNELGCYLPGSRLEDALRRQQVCGDFELH